MKILDTQEELIDFVLYGDIYEASSLILGDKSPSHEQYKLWQKENDIESIVRVHLASCIKAFFDNRLCSNGCLKNPEIEIVELNKNNT